LLLQLTGLYLANGYLSEAKSTLVEFVRRFRNSSSLFERLDVYRLIGDYHYSCVRNRLQLSTFDCDFGNQDLATLNLTTNQLATNKVLLTEYRKTLANYTNALEIARSVDKLLDTTGYETMILARLQWINVTPK